MNKKNNMYVVIAVLIIIVIAISVIAVGKNKRYANEAVKSASDIQIEQAVKSDTTTAINTSIDNIKVEDTSDADLKAIDDELKNL